MVLLAAYIALQQAVHGVGLRHIATDFGNNFFLCIGQGKRQSVAQGLINVPSPPNAVAEPLTRFCRTKRMESCCAKVRQI